MDDHIKRCQNTNSNDEIEKMTSQERGGGVFLSSLKKIDKLSRAQRCETVGVQFMFGKQRCGTFCPQRNVNRLYLWHFSS